MLASPAPPRERNHLLGSVIAKPYRRLYPEASAVIGRFPTFQTEPVWPDTVGRFTFCQTRVSEAQETGSLPGNVRTVVTLHWCHIILKNLSRGASRLTGRTAICIQGPARTNIGRGSKTSGALKKSGEQSARSEIGGDMKRGAVGQGGAGFFEATLVPRVGKGRCKGPANASKSSN